MSDTADLSVDFTDPDIKGGDFEALPIGNYLAAVTDWTVTATKNPGKLAVGTPGVNVEFTIQDGEFENRKVWTNYWLHSSTLGFFKAMLKATGKFTDDEIDAIRDAGDACDKSIGAEVVLKLARREYNGDYVNDVKGVKNKDTYRPGQASASQSMLP